MAEYFRPDIGRQRALQYMHMYANPDLRDGTFAQPPKGDLRKYLKGEYGADDELVKILEAMFASSFVKPNAEMGKIQSKTETDYRDTVNVNSQEPMWKRVQAIINE